MVSKEIIDKVRHIEIQSKKLVNEIFSGEYYSSFKGNGMEYEESREYSHGDDVRAIDWKLSARQGTLFVKRFREERERTLILMIDVSQSMLFGKRQEKIAEIGAALALSAVKNSDKVGCLFFSDTIEKYIPAKKGIQHSLSIIENILTYKGQSTKTDISQCLKTFMETHKKSAILFLLSDFLDTDFEKQVKVVSKKHDVILFQVYEALEKKLPRAIFYFSDAETGAHMCVDNSSGRYQSSDSLLSAKNAISISSTEDFIKPLMLFFKRRMRR